MDYKRLGERLRDLRLEKGYSQEKVARDLGISLSGYKKTEKGLNGVSIDLLIAFEQYFDTDLAYLVHGIKTANCVKKIEKDLRFVSKKEQELIQKLVQITLETLKTKDEKGNINQ